MTVMQTNSHRIARTFIASALVGAAVLGASAAAASAATAATPESGPAAAASSSNAAEQTLVFHNGTGRYELMISYTVGGKDYYRQIKPGEDFTITANHSNAWNNFLIRAYGEWTRTPMVQGAATYYEGAWVNPWVKEAYALNTGASITGATETINIT